MEPLWLREMVSCFAYPRTGIVGARLLYPDHTVQHAGVIIGLGGLAGHWFCGKPSRYPGTMGRLHLRQTFSGVTGACMLISRACFEAVGFFDEDLFAIAYNDIDFCLRAGEAGYRTVWTPFATLIHHESASRGSDETRQNAARFRTEKDNLSARHKTASFDDRAYNPWYSRHNSEPGLVFLDRLPKPRS
jgi:O-antigen biosynthesis protein